MKEKLLRLLQASTRLPSPPGVALRILELARSDDATLEDLARTLGTDPALAGRILKFVNSPQAGLGRTITSLEQAVSQIGFRGVQMMALSFSLVSSGRGQVCAGFEFEHFWSRSLACAVASKVLAETAGRLDPNEAFITGLLYHIGQIAMACGLPESYGEVVELARTSGQSCEEIETRVFESTHIEVGAWLLQEWKLPDPIWQAMLQAQPPTRPRLPGERVDSSTLLYIADIIATLLSDSKSERSAKVDEIVALMSDQFDMGAEAWSGLYDEIAVEWRAYGQLLSVSAGTDKSFRDLQEEAREQITALSMAAQIENLGMREQNQRLLQQSRTDGLTGVANRASFDERLAAELDRVRLNGRPLVLCLIDVDHFKQFNDVHGHQFGDAVLQAVARALEDNVRKVDFVARYGGEEFAVVVGECSIEHARSLAERLRTAVGEIQLESQGRPLQVTVSIGLASAQWPSRARTSAELIRAADDCLYQAKREGRNCCRDEMSWVRAA